jgi:hypothetical protein
VKRWMLRHPTPASQVIGIAAVVTLVYGLGHIASAFGVEFGAIPAAEPFTHLFVGTSLLISSLTARAVYLRLKRVVDRRRIGNRQWMAHAIRERAARNYTDAPADRKLIQEP